MENGTKEQTTNGISSQSTVAEKDDKMTDVTPASPAEGNGDEEVVYNADIVVEDEEGDEVEVPDDAVHVFETHTAESLAVHCNPTDVTMIATGGCDDRAIVYDLKEMRDLAELDGQGESVSCVQFSTDGKQLAIGSENGAISVLYLGGAQAPPGVLDGPGAAISFLSWHPRGPVLLAGSEDKCAYMWNAAKGSFMTAFIGHDAPITCGSFTADGKRVITAGRDAALRVWSPSAGTTLVRVQANMPGIGGTFHAAEINCMAVGHADTPLANIVASGDSNGHVYLSNIESGQVISELARHEGGVETLVFSPAQLKPHMLASGGADGTVRIRDMSTGVERCSFEHAEVIAKVVWHPSKPVVASGSSDGTLCLWNVITSAKLALLRGHKDFITDLCFASNGEALVSTSADSSVRVFDVRQFVQ